MPRLCFLLSPRPESLRSKVSVARPAFCPWLRSRHPHARAALRWPLAAALLLSPALPLHAQGCSQCLDSTRATPPQVQSAYRHAIYLLGGAATALFVSGTLLLRNKR